MKSGILLAAILAVVLAGCKMPGENQDFNQLENEFVHGALALSPVSATAAGYHVHDGKRLDEMLDDFSPFGIGEQRHFFRSLHDRMEVIKQDTLDPEQKADYRLMDDQVMLALMEVNLIRSYTRNPTVYVELVGNALFSPFVLEYAPKPERYRHIVKRLERVPALMLEGRQALKDSPEIWIKVALEEDEGNIALIDKTLRAGAPPELKADYDKAAAGALDALQKYDDFLKNDLSKKPASLAFGQKRLRFEV